MLSVRTWQRVCLLCLLVLAGGCQSAFPDDELRGRITVWHGLTGQAAAEMALAMDRFQEIHPHVRVVDLAVAEDQILAEFVEAAQNGLGPDLLIGRNDWIQGLADANYIRPLSPMEAPPTLSNARNRSLVEYEDQLFGIPFGLAPRALFYNTDLVEAPPTSLDGLLQEAADGNRVEFVPRFEDAYWGIQAFGSGLFDSEGRFTLADSGFEEWLSWLDKAQNATGVILSDDEVSLLELFASGQIAYFVAGPESISQIRQQMDEENAFEIGVAPLPAGPAGPAGPLLPAETIMLYSHASPEQERIANELAAHLVNERQAIRFMRELEKVPANPRVRVDRRIYPLVSGFERQSRTSVPWPNDIPTDSLFSAGNRAYTSVLSGASTPAEAVCQFGREVATSQGWTAAEMSLPEGCELSE